MGVITTPGPKDKTYYPRCGLQRESYRTKSGKKITDKQWAIYDFVQTIPCGKVTTYKHISDALSTGSPRSVGAALRNNPFAPFVPCHRVIASNFFIGGFFGEWGRKVKLPSKCSKIEVTGNCAQKLELLLQEGIEFTKDGYLLDKENAIWRG